MTVRRVTVFVIAVDLVAVIWTVTLIPYHVTDYLLGLSLLASFALMTGTGPVRIPSTKISGSVSDVFVFTALGAFGPMPAGCVAAAGVLGATFQEERHRKPIHFAFNMGNVLFSTAAASVGYLLAGGMAGGPYAVRSGRCSRLPPSISCSTPCWSRPPFLPTRARGSGRPGGRRFCGPGSRRTRA